MALLAMKKISIYSEKHNRKKILEMLQRRGAVEIRSEEVAPELFSKTDTSQARITFEKNSKSISDAVAILDNVQPPEKVPMKMLAGREPVDGSVYDRLAENSAEMTKNALRIISLQKSIDDGRADIARLNSQAEALKPWLSLDISMRTIGTKSTNVFIGSFPEELDAATLKERLYPLLPEDFSAEVEIVSSAPQLTCAFVLCHSRFGLKAETALRSLGFTYPSSTFRRPPSEQIEHIKKEVADREQEIESARLEISSFAGIRRDLLYTSDYFTMRAEKYRVLGELWQSRHIFVITGFIPADAGRALSRGITDSFNAFVELETPGEDEDIPVKLKNNGFAAPVEPVLEGYSLPGTHEIDPCSVMAIFYYVLFGMMLSDAAYGIIITIVCAVVLLKFKNLEESMHKTFKMFFFCGISTTFWGVMFGSYFGDAITVVASTFFNTDITIKPIWFAPLDDPMRLLVFSFLLGIIHLFTGLALQFYQLVKRKKFSDAIYDVVFWYFLVGGLIILLLSTPMFDEIMNVGFTLPSPIGTVAAVFAVIGAIGIVFTAGRESKNPFKRLLKGLYGLYGVSSYLSDILSYSRLLALGLATGVIATVFNKMGSMAGGGVVGVILFVFVFLFGHTLNIGINMLGAYVHTNRLQYVEFFGKFYNGGGKKFEPFAANTKYFKFTEEK